MLQCKEEFKHRGPIYTLLSETIEGVPVLFSGGVDGTIKYWNAEYDDQKEANYITTIFGHKGTVLALAYCKSRCILISSSTDMTIKFWKLKDNFDKVLNPLFQCILTIRDFNLHNKPEEKPFWINTLSLKESDIVELFAGDTKGRVHFYHYVDQGYIKAKESEKRLVGSYNQKIQKKWNMDNFNPIKNPIIHNRTVIKLVHSIFDSMIYSIGFDNHLIGYNIKTDTGNPNNIYNH